MRILEKNYVNVPYRHYLTYADCQKTVISCSSFLTDEGALTIVGNLYSVRALYLKKATEKNYKRNNTGSPVK